MAHAPPPQPFSLRNRQLPDDPSLSRPSRVRLEAQHGLNANRTTRVVLGHSGNEALFESRLPSLQVATLLLLVGAVLRAFGDFSPERPHWLSAASYLWMLAAGLWGFAVLPKVRIADPAGDVSCSVAAEL